MPLRKEFTTTSAEKVVTETRRDSPAPDVHGRLLPCCSLVLNTLVPVLRGLDWLGIDRVFAGCVAAPPTDVDVEGTTDGALLAMETDSALLNLVGAEAAEKWAESGTLQRRLAVDEESEANDEHGRTAHLPFAGLAGIEDGPAAWGHAGSLSPATPSSAGGRKGGPFLTPVSLPLRFAHQRASGVEPARDKGKKRARDSESPAASPTRKRARRRRWGRPSGPTSTRIPFRRRLAASSRMTQARSPVPPARSLPRTRRVPRGFSPCGPPGAGSTRSTSSCPHRCQRLQAAYLAARRDKEEAEWGRAAGLSFETVYDEGEGREGARGYVEDAALRARIEEALRRESGR
ncbi:hypothetical protein FB451DRAFT_1558272 [Mycena latifolia]|nr:hypothetical protein FB451DRAFT_1558272 [Mycena latifolia]